MLCSAATSITILVTRLRNRGVMARLSAEPPSANGTACDVKLRGLQYLQVQKAVLLVNSSHKPSLASSNSHIALKYLWLVGSLQSLLH
jgi:hypothetical protein